MSETKSKSFFDYLVEIRILREEKRKKLGHLSGHDIKVHLLKNENLDFGQIQYLWESYFVEVV